MYLRANLKILFVILITVAAIISSILVMAIVFKSILFLLATIPYVLLFFSWWIAFGREIRLTEEGCIVRFLYFTKVYRWEQLKTKRRAVIKIGNRLGFPYYNGILLSCRKVRFPKRFPTEYTFDIPSMLHPFSLIFILFEPIIDSYDSRQKEIKENREYHDNYLGFFADEEQLFSLLHSWGVTLDDE